MGLKTILLSGLFVVWSNSVAHAFAPATSSFASAPKSALRLRRNAFQLYSAVEERKAEEKTAPEPSPVHNEKAIATLGNATPYEELTIGVTKETYKGENRVSQTPESIAALIKAGFKVVVESGGTCHAMKVLYFLSFVANENSSSLVNSSWRKSFLQ